MSELQALDNKIETLRSEVGEKFDRVHEDFKELTRALRELVRIDGNITRVEDTQVRHGKQLDDHELRVRTLEQAHAGERVKVGVIGRGQLLLFTTLTTVVGSVITGVVVYAATH